MAVFWNTLDTYLVTLFTTEMGVGSAYGTLQVQTINSNVFADAHVFSTWTLPAIATAGWRVDYDARQHMGSSGRIYVKTYRCMAFGIVSGVSTSLDTLTDNVKEIYERMELAIRTDRFGLGSGEKGRGALIRTGEIDITHYPADNLDSTRRLGIAYFTFDVESTTT